MTTSNKIGLVAITLSAIFLINKPAFALDKIYSPTVTKGELEMEYAGSTTFDKNHDKNNIQEHEISIGYGVTDYWLPELYVIFEKEPDESAKITGFELENRFQLAEQGKYFIDPGLLVAYTHATKKDTPDELELKLLLQKDFGKFTSIANIGFAQTVGEYSQGHGGPDYSFLLNNRYRYNEYFQPGVELQSDLGHGKQFVHFDEQENYIGPAAYGRILGNLKYQAAYLFGVSDASAQSAARLLVEYEMHF